ncbi:hypothetical protein KKF84_08450 [Myxococcota bacterium]|nr:hypothetical protein [Myxococcota bacterium]MBU1535338.1 hypothetical protein [Myxococcota bacterium]
MITNVYVPLGVEGFELCHPFHEGDFETLNMQIDGTPRWQKWSPLQMRLVNEDEGKSLSESDSPWLGSHALIFRQRALQQLGTVLKAHGELLPIRCPDVELSIFNPKIIDGFDEEGSSVLRFSNGRIMRIIKHVFRADIVVGVDLFKIPNLRVSPTFVGDRFVQIWNSSGLLGLDFKKVWSSA